MADPPKKTSLSSGCTDFASCDCGQHAEIYPKNSWVRGRGSGIELWNSVSQASLLMTLTTAPTHQILLIAKQLRRHLLYTLPLYKTPSIYEGSWHPGVLLVAMKMS